LVRTRQRPRRPGGVAPAADRISLTPARETMPVEPPPLSPRRRIAALGTLLAGLSVFAIVVNQHVPFGAWLIWRYLAFLAGAGLLVISSVSLGHLLLGRVLRVTELPLGERLFFDFALGLLAFGLGIFGLGLGGLLVPA